jgi:ribA/ribD-fused uncharacterized protein
MIDITKTHAFFFTEWPSNFYYTTIEYKGQKFFCSEQAFMWEKAKYFKDEETASLILMVDTPMKAKQLGRKVRNYVDSEWDKVRFDVMYEVNLAKFSQNDELKRKLLDPKFDGKTFVEASPYDNIWGIKIGLGDARLHDEKNWMGQNLLGKVITKVRETLKSESK